MMNVNMSYNDYRVQKAVNIYSKPLLWVYDFIVYQVATPYMLHCPAHLILEHYNENIRLNHLDVGVGTGCLLKGCKQLKDIKRLGIMDLNPNSLEKSKQLLNEQHPEVYQANILKPFETTAVDFDSIGMNYLLHCIPGNFEEKEVIFSNLKEHLSKDGILFGCTVLGKDINNTLHTKLFLKLYQWIGIFNNAEDTYTGLKKSLSRHFTYYEVNVVGNVAFFRASDCSFL